MLQFHAVGRTMIRQWQKIEEQRQRLHQPEASSKSEADALREQQREMLREKLRQHQRGRSLPQERYGSDPDVPSLTLIEQQSPLRDETSTEKADESSQISRKAYQNRLVRLMEVACLSAPLKAEELKQGSNDETLPFLCSTLPDDEGTLPLLGHFGLGNRCCNDAQPSRGGLQEELLELKRRREAASELLEEVEKEAIALQREYAEKETLLLQQRSSLASSEGRSFMSLFPIMPFCNDSTPCGSSSETREFVSAKQKLPALRSELRERLAEAQVEIEELRTLVQVTRVQATPRENTRRRRRRPHLDFLAEHDLSDTLLEASFRLWRFSFQKRRSLYCSVHALTARCDLATVEVCLSFWKLATLQLWADGVEARLASATQIVAKFAAQMLLGESRSMFQAVFAEWWKLSAKAKRKSIEAIMSSSKKDEGGKDESKKLHQEIDIKDDKAKRCCVLM